MGNLSLFFDFDGTLVDSRQRQFQLFCDLVPGVLWSFNEYWDIKRAGVSQSEMLKKYFGFNEKFINEVHIDWMNNIEAPNRLSLDAPFEGVSELLDELHKSHKLYLVTARQNSRLVHEQLREYGWNKCFSDVLVTAQQTSKTELIRKSGHLGGCDVMIGDTGEDITTGLKLGMFTIAVTYGTLNRAVLGRYSPNLLIDSLSELFDDSCTGLMINSINNL